MIIETTQYMRPDGHRNIYSMEIPDEYEKQVQKIKDCSCFFTCERLMTGEAVSYISHNLGDFAQKITPRIGKCAVGDFLALINEFDPTAFEVWKTEQVEAAISAAEREG